MNEVFFIINKNVKRKENNNTSTRKENNKYKKTTKIFTTKMSLVRFFYQYEMLQKEKGQES